MTDVVDDIAEIRGAVFQVEHDGDDVITIYATAASRILDELDRQSAEIATLTAEVDRLNQSLSWEQHRAGRIGTHGPNCHLWGHQHYECLLRKFNALETHPND